MLLSILAFLIGATIGRARGGRLRAFASVQVDKTGFLAAGLAAVLIVSIIGPTLPIAWMLVAYVCFAVFGLRNLHLAGMVVLLIGLLMNLAPLLANGAVPVSELALISVDDVDASGQPNLDPIRESDATATSFTIFGDIVPIPLLNVVVSLGDLVIAVALADIAMNILLRSRPGRPDEAAFSYARDADETAVLDLRDRPDSVTFDAPRDAKKGQPAHSSRRRARRKPLHSIHVPAHAALNTPKQVEPDSNTIKEQRTEPKQSAEAETPRADQPTFDAPPAEDVVDLRNDVALPTTEAKSSVVDLRPIIDLTTSPTDQQLQEFLRRRSEADALLGQNEDRVDLDAAHHSPRRRSSRGRRSQNHKVDA